MTAKKDKPQKTSMPGVDPALEQKVDQLMSVELPNDSSEPKKAEQPTSAPLLPTDKLPNLEGDKTNPAPTQAEDIPTEAPVKAAQLSDEKEAFTPPEKLTLQDKVGIEDPATNRAVDEILAEESNKALASEDTKKTKTPELPKPKKGFFSAWWHNKLYRRLTVLVVLAVIASAAVYPPTRYFVLNNLGVRSTSSLTIIDEKTKQPLKNVEVTLASQTTKTDINGQVQFQGIKLGQQDLIIKKPAFADVDQIVTIGWGSNPLGDIRLTPIGSRYTFVLSDFLSGKPINKAEATNGESSAVANSKGEVVLTLPNSKDSEVEITITASNYRTEVLKLPVKSKETKELKMVPSRKAVFVSKREGTYDVYKTDVDGKNEEKIFAGTGTENENTTALVAHPTDEIAALVSTRGVSKDKDGNLLSTLTFINISTNETNSVIDGERIQIIGWVGSRLVFVRTVQDTKENDKKRNKIMSYDVQTNEEKELASTNYFNDVIIVGGAVLYAPAEYSVNGKVGLYKIDADGNNKATVYGNEVWSLFRTSFDTVSASVGDDWYEYKIPDSSFDKIDGTPPVLKSRIYNENPAGSKSLWVDERDGKGVLLLYLIANNKDKTIQTASGLKDPTRWLDNDHVIYRVNNGQETADYVMSISGGESKKISDVTNVAGIEGWYYY